MIKTKDEVNSFLRVIQEIINQSFENVIIINKTNGNDKTRKFQIEYGINHKRICEELLKLDISNYAETDKDNKAGWTGEVWIFGLMMEVAQNHYMEVYIKLKFRGSVICMSFHPKEYDIRYPYN
jgi:hypothetical protein